AYGLDYNWNIQGFVTSSKGETISLSAIQDVERTAKQGTLKVEKSDSKSAKAFEAKGLLGFNVFGNGIQINENIVMADSCIIMPTLNGIYTYWVTAVYDACESVPSNEVIVDFNLGINKEDAMVSIYPNPATDVLNIKLSNDIKEIKVYNYVGQVVYGRNVESSDSVIKLNTSNYNTGTYLIQFTTEDGKTITKKVVIIR
ncbi:MAG: T9SS type A sorting domain-containing protein, partial [Bacteroidales bacterium]|nr:T9SS type A sorting domain-containing protein [Bacteroidales bacterium]